MIGAIIGDVIGAPFEWRNERRKDFELFGSQSRFTDDTVLTAATAEALLTNRPYAEVYRKYFNLYPSCGFGGMFLQWGMDKNKGPYNSYGNGSAMRVGPVGYAASTLSEAIEEARKSAVVTHNHPEGIRGAEATAAAVYLAKSGFDKEFIRISIRDGFFYDLDFDMDNLRKSYKFDHSCQGTVPQAIFCFLQGQDFEDCIRNAISIGGDSDTIAAICGSIAGAYYNIPAGMWRQTSDRLDQHLLNIVDRFSRVWEQSFC